MKTVSNKINWKKILSKCLKILTNGIEKSVKSLSKKL